MPTKSLAFGKLIIAALIVTSCTHDRSPVHSNDPGVLQAKPKDAEVKSLTGEELNLFRTQDIPNESLLLSESPQDIFTQFVRPLAAIVLNADSLADTQIATSPRMQNFLRLLNLAIERIAPSSPAGLDDILNNYDTLLLSGCDANLVGCLNISFFSQDTLSSEITLLLAQRQKDLNAFYSRLLIAFDLSHMRSQKKIVSLYLSRVGELHDEYLRLASAHSPLLERHARIIELLVQNQAARIGHEDTARPENGPGTKWLRDLHIFDFNNSSDPILSRISDELLKLAAQTNLYDGDRKLSQELQTSLKKSQDAASSFSHRQSDLLINHPNLFKTLGLTRIDASNEYFLILNGLFEGKLSIASATAIWTRTHKESNLLIDLIKSYVQVRFADLIVQSNAIMQLQFQNSEQVTSQIVQDAILKSASVNTLVLDFLKRAASVRDFSYQVLQTQGNSPAGSAQLDAMMANLKYDIRMHLSLPHTILMSYILAQRKFNMSNPVTGEKVDYNTVIKNLFAGHIDLWFDYGPDQANLRDGDGYVFTPIEVLFAIHNAMYADAFNSFAIDPNDFFETMISSLVEYYILPRFTGERPRGYLNDEQNDLNQIYESNDWKSLLNVCDGIKNHHGFENRIALSGLEKGAFFGDRITKFGKYFDHPQKNASGYLLFSIFLTQELEEIRTTLMPNIKFIKLMLSDYQNFSKLTGTPDVTGSQVTRLTNLESQVQSFLTDLAKYKKQNDDCRFILLGQERNMQAEILKREIEYLKQVHREMSKLRQNTSPSDMFMTNYGQDVRALGVAPQESFDSETFNYARFDFLVRMKSYYEKPFATETANFQALDLNTRIVIPDKLQKNQIYKEQQVYAIPYSESEDTFVATTLTAAIHQAESRSHVYWFKPKISDRSVQLDLNSIAMHFAGLTSFYRITQQWESADIRNLFPASDLSELSFNYIRFINLTDDDKNLFKMAHINTRFTPDLTPLNGVFMSHQTSNAIPFLDMIYANLFTEILGNVLSNGENGDSYDQISVDMKPNQKIAKIYYNYLSKRGTEMFSTASSFESDMTLYYKNLIKIEKQNAINFAQIAAQSYTTDQTNHSVLNLEVELGNPKTLNTYLSDFEQSNFKTLFEIFDRETGSYFH